MGIIPYEGRAAVASAVKAGVLHFAWGRGNPNWGTNQVDTFVLSPSSVSLNHDGAYGVERVLDRDFSSLARWLGREGATATVSGRELVVQNGASGNGYFVQALRLSGSKRFRVRGRARVGVGSSGAARVALVDATTGQEVGGQDATGTAYSDIDFYADTPARGRAELRLIVASAAPSSTASFDNLSIVDANDLPVRDVIVRSLNLAVRHNPGIDYTVDQNTGLISRIPGGAIAEGATVSVSFTIDTPPEDLYQDRLLSEAGRRLIESSDFVVPDPAGAIEVPQGTFSKVTYPTRNLYVEVVFGFADADTETIRETGVFMGTETDPSLPGGQRYFEPDEVTNEGIVLTLENLAAISRSAAARETFRVVLNF